MQSHEMDAGLKAPGRWASLGNQPNDTTHVLLQLRCAHVAFLTWVQEGSPNIIQHHCGLPGTEHDSSWLSETMRQVETAVMSFAGFALLADCVGPDLVQG